MSTFFEQVEKTAPAGFLSLNEDDAQAYKRFEKSALILEQLLSPKSFGDKPLPKLSMKEALGTTDASILFPKVISDVLIRPLEPMMIGQTLLSRRVMVDNVRSIEFPSLGAIRAFDMAEGQEYHEQLPGFNEKVTEVKVVKVGLMLSVAEEVVMDSQWDVLALYLEAAGNAMIRHKEKKIWDDYSKYAISVFDNTLAVSTGGQTRGTDVSGNANGSVSYEDFLDLFGAMIANEYNPTDLVMHPLAWTVFAKDPLLRFQMLFKGGVQANFGKIGPLDEAVQANAPFGITTHLSPFVPFSFNTTLTGPLSGLAAANVTDIYALDRSNPILVLQREMPSTEYFDKPERDIRQVKMRERYSPAVLNEGKAVTAIRNIRLVDNFKPVYSVTTVAPV